MSQYKPRIPPEIPYKESRDTVILWKKGKKKKPNPVHFVDCTWNLVRRYCEGSSEKAAHNVKEIKARTLERLASIAELPENVIQRIGEGEIGIDVASLIAGIKDPKLQVRVAKVVARMNAHDARRVVRFAKKCPDASFEQFKQRLLESKRKTEKIYEAILPLNKSEFTKLKDEARKMRIKWDELSVKIINEWLGARR